MIQKQLLSEKIAENIGKSIVGGFYKIGDQMPNEMELSEELGISRATLREAIKILISQNVLEVRRGIGTFVSHTPGLSTDPLGLDYILIAGEKREVVKWAKRVHADAAEHLHLFGEDERTIWIGNQDIVTVNELVSKICDISETIFLRLEMQFGYRMVKVVDDALRRLTGEFQIQYNSSIKDYCSKYVDAIIIGDKDKTAAAVSSMLDLILIQMEEA
ncbi:MAG: GntR family transcriptional regulator [Clostridiales bacterium]|jgi:DNA-binding transcriptional regulator YhcF (GntR family)|nr:GntR family transcriptional regulator [Clostridiales bacterium]